MREFHHSSVKVSSVAKIKSLLLPLFPSHLVSSFLRKRLLPHPTTNISIPYAKVGLCDLNALRSNSQTC